MEMSSNIDYKTVVIAIVFSVILSTGITMTVPQVQDAIRGPQGEQGIQGIQGKTGSPGISEVTQAELDELVLIINELESDRDEIYDYIWARIIGGETSSLWDILGGLQEDPGGMAVAADPIRIAGVDPWDTLTTLSSDIYYLRDEFENLRDHIRDDLIPRIEDLETDMPDMTPIMTSIYDSGWFGINAGTSKYLTTLPNQNVFVYMIGRTSGNTAHQEYYGGDSQLLGTVQLNKGAYWMINSDKQLRVYRELNDNYYKYIRVVVWQLP